MKNLIQTKIPNVYAVKVPMESIKFRIEYGTYNFLIDEFEVAIKLDCYSNIYKILGFCTKSEISFDASEVVDNQDFSDMDYDGNWIEITRYWDYEYKQFSAMDSDESFRSALPEEIVWENEYGNEEPNLEPECCGMWQDDGFGNPKCCCVPIPSNESRQLQYLWQIAQEQITEKLLILQKL